MHHALAQPLVADLNAKFVVQTATTMGAGAIVITARFWIARNGGRVDRISWAF